MAEIPRVGFGLDVHPPDVDRSLWLGGVRFAGETGLAGHSDGDAVCHAVADAVLGAASLGDIGEHFPETDPSIAGIAGLELLARVVRLVEERSSLLPQSCDLTVLCERPPIAPRRREMSGRLAEALGIAADRVSVKATRPEGLGLTGEGIGCMAVVVLA